MGLDIIIYAVIAIVLLARLWAVLGRRNDSDPQRPNPFITPAPGPKEFKEDPVKALVDSDSHTNPYALLQPFQIAPASLAGGLEQIKALDPSFDEKVFLKGARAAFTMIVEDFAKGDMARIERLLGPDVLPHFQGAIEARRKTGQIMESRIETIRDAEVTAAHAEGPRASLTVRFVTEQQNTLRDAGGKIISGAAGQVEEIIDLWTFARDTTSGDPNWILVETRS